MKLKKTVDNGRMTLAVSGRVDTVSAPELVEALTLDGVTDLTLDLAGVPYMSSAGLQCLLMAHKTMAANGGRLRLTGIQPLVRDVLDMTGFSDFFDVPSPIPRQWRKDSMKPTFHSKERQTMGRATCESVMAVLALAVSLTAAANPMIDDSHDRVQTTLDPMMDRIGTLVPRSAKEIGPTRLAIGCEMLPRGYGDFENFKEYLPPLGIARVRLHAGWAKLEPEPGRWDFEWLDRQVNWLIDNGMEPLLETSYGNPVYPGAGGASLSDGMPRGEAALKAWDRYVEKLVTRYPQVKNWACWNEPNNIDANTPEIVVDNNIRTAKIILKHIPDAKIGMLTLGTRNMNAFTEACLKLFKEKDAIGLFTWIIYHDYHANPDDCYEGVVDAWVKIVRKYAPELKIWNGESGATSDMHFSAGVSSRKWNSELTQSKWDARHLVADLGHGFDSLVFTLYDPCYDYPERYTKYIPPYWVRTRPDRFMKRMGLLKCNDRLEVVKVKPAYYTVQNIASLFDSTIEYSRKVKSCLQAKGVVTYTFASKESNIPLVAFWDASNHPENDNAVREAVLTITGKPIKEPVWIDLVTGAIYQIPKRMLRGARNNYATYEGIPYYDAPVVVTDRSLVMKNYVGTSPRAGL